jgi:transcriptional regulator with XRE-family HTH domain
MPRSFNQTGSPLQVLIAEHMANTRDTVADIAARGNLPRQTVSRMLNDGPTGAMPRRKTLEGLATGLGLSVRTVADAAAQSTTGADAEPLDNRLAVLLDMCRRLPVSQVDVLLAAARAMERTQGDTHVEHSQAV